jgi:hypothetical protein
MAGFAQRITWGMAGFAVTRTARSVTRRRLRRDSGEPKVPRRARRSGGLGTALAWAAGAGVLLGLSDLLREQRKDVTERS